MNIELKQYLVDDGFLMENYDIASAHEILTNKMPPESNMTGWVKLHIEDEELNKIKRLAKKIQNQSNILIVIGAGGSYCGARAVIESVKSQNYNDLANDTPKIYFLGHNLSGKYMENILKICDQGEVSINVISKSGTTLEPSAAFRILRAYMEKRYGDEAKERIICTTDAVKGTLRQLSEKIGYETLVVPSNIGGRYSVLTPVGLLPIAVSGIDIDALLQGAYDGEKEYSVLENNSCYKYAALRKYLADKQNKKVEMLATFEPCAETFLQWHRQLYGESLGKQGIGVLPTVAVYTRDLHSIGQYIQDGSPILFETIFKFNDTDSSCKVPFNEINGDDLNYIADMKLEDINNSSIDGVIKAHNEGNVPVILVTTPKLDAYNIGNLIYFLERACAINGILDEINPFDQPGVEAYKKNIQKILRNK